MKKSEAARRFDEWVWANQEKLKYLHTIEQCDCALDFLVKELGMLPPSAPLDKLGGLDNSWEPEDEQNK